MDQEQEWKRFVVTGSVSDYLEYRQAVQNQSQTFSDTITDQGARKDHQYAGSSDIDWHGADSIHHEGI